MKDAQGLPLAAEHRDAAAAYDRCVAAYLGARADTRELVDALVALDPRCVLGHCLDGYLHMLASKRSAVPLARAALVRALGAAPHVMPRREALHVAALDAWSRGDMRRAADAWDELLGQLPRDVAALKVSQFALSYLGVTQRMLATAT